MTSLGETKLRNVGDYFATNLSRGADPLWKGWCRIWNSYRAKYVTCKNARLTPFIHACVFAIAINYYMEYPHIKGKYTEQRLCTLLIVHIFLLYLFLGDISAYALLFNPS